MSEASLSIMKRILLLTAVAEGLLVLALAVWWGYFFLELRGWTGSFLMWAAVLVGAVLAVGVLTQFLAFAQRRSYRFSLRSLLLATFVLSVLLGLGGDYLIEQRAQRAAHQAMLHVHALNGQVSQSVPRDVSSDADPAPTDPRVSTSITFDGTLLEQADFEQLARIPTLSAITIKDTPLRVEDLLPLQRSRRLQILVLENTGLSDQEFERIEERHSDGHVFQSREAWRQWSRERVRELEANGEL